jgi:hypothetical protein
MMASKMKRLGIFILLILLVSCNKTDNRVPSAEQGIENNQNNDTSLISKREPILSYNSEPEEFTLIKMDTPTVFIKKDDNIDILIKLRRNEHISPNISETDNYIFFDILEQKADVEERTSLIYRKKDGKFFHFNADGGHGNMLYYINYETRSFDFFEITDNGIKKDIRSVPIPNESDNWYSVQYEFLVSYNYSRKVKEIYTLNGTTLIKRAEYPINVSIIGSSHLFAYYSLYSNNNTMKLINLSNMKETNIKNGAIIDITKNSIFFVDGNKMAHYDASTDTYSFMEYIIKAENARNSGFYLSDYFIQNYEECPLGKLYSVNNNQLLFNSGNNKICMYDFDTDLLYILFDYNIYTRPRGLLYLINDSYFFSGSFGVADIVSLDDKRIICRFIMNWIDPTEIISDVSYMWYYETREGNIIIYPRYGSNTRE